MPIYTGFKTDGQTQITPSTPIVLDEATGNETALDLAYTVNKATSGNDTGLVLNKTDTASPGTSLLMDLQVGGASQVTIDDGGKLTLDVGDTRDTTTGLWFGATGDTGFYESATDFLRIQIGGSERWIMATTQFQSNLSTGPTVTSVTSTATLPVFRPNRAAGTTGIGANAAGEISLINSATETARLNFGESNAFLHLYNDHGSDGTNYERLEITGQTADNFLVQTAAGGTGGVTAISIGSELRLNVDETFGDTRGLMFGATSDSGLTETSADILRIKIAGTNRFAWSGNAYLGHKANSGSVLNEAASSTNPSLAPWKEDSTTGIGANAAGEISLISQAEEVARFSEGLSNNHIHLYNDHGSDGTNYERLEITGQTAGNFLVQTAAGGTGTARDIAIDSKVVLDPSGTRDSTTGIFFSDGDTGIHEDGDDVLRFIINGLNEVIIDSSGIVSSNTVGFGCYNETPSATNPVLIPRRNFATTGIGSNASNEISLICQANEVARFDTNATAAETRFMIYDVDNATLERVSVGAADSGGSGFKVLRIPN